MELKGQYLTYNDYKALGGNLDQTPFNILEYEVRRKIDERTQGRLKGIKEIPEEVKMCAFALIGCVSCYDSSFVTSNKNIASESTDGYSISYITGGTIQETINSKNVEINDIINTYLFGGVVNGKHILYIGVR